MLLFIDGQFVRGSFEPVLPDEFMVEFNHATGCAELWHGSERVMTGFTWYGFGVDIEPKTGKIGEIHGKKPRIRAVFAGMSVQADLSS